MVGRYNGNGSRLHLAVSRVGRPAVNADLPPGAMLSMLCCTTRSQETLADDPFTIQSTDNVTGVPGMTETLGGPDSM